MLRTLRSRRRPRYGAHVCAVIAALLLLLSVSILHSRLGFDRGSQSQFLSSKIGFQYSPNLELSQDSTDEMDAVVANPLLEDVENDGLGNSEEDRIDELDVVEEDSDDQSRVSDEEEILRGVELEEESNLDGMDSSRNRRSGYYFDHVVGAIRRAFDKHLIDPWEDYSSFDFSLKSEDRSKIAFGSDDQPVDEDVRNKLDSIKEIEDALLLKTNGGNSALREGWANWFEKKGDFLRRDRMFKSNLELLNPLSNPLLQDPDGVGSTFLTRGDKLMQKALLNEFRKLPFGVKKPSGIPEKPQELKSVGVGDDGSPIKKTSGLSSEEMGTKEIMGGRINEVKGVERRTLDDDGKNIDSFSEPSNSAVMVDAISGSKPTGISKEQRISSNERSKMEPLRLNNVNGADKVADSSIREFNQQSSIRNLDSKRQIKSELSEHKYADGRRWGYFPGLRPHLSFSNFMEEFFKQSLCSMRVFMVWNSPPWMYGVRHQRGLESLLFHHPDVCVVVFSETIELDFFKDFVKDGFKVAVAMPNLDELLKDTPTHVFASVWYQWRKTNFYSVHYSELVRLAALYKYGGLYLDSDIIVLKPLSSIGNSVGVENQLDKTFNGAVMAFEKNSHFIMECLKEFYSTYDDTRLRWNGADLLTRVDKKLLSPNSNYNKQLELKIQPSSMFFPISSQNISRYFTAPANENERVQQDILFRTILDESFAFHFWNSLTSTLVPEPDSLVARLINHHCIHCLDVL